MSTYILVHGAWHGAWCWDRLTPLLEAKGHTVIAVDLPGHGQDQAPLAQITLQAFVDRVVAAVDAQAEPAILVGHSMGGTVISQAAEARPERIERLVYLAAFLLNDGDSLFQVGTADPGSLLVANLIPDEASGVLRINPGAIREIFYHDCPEAEAVRAAALLRPEPIAPLVTPLALTPARFGRVPRVYIECLQDRALSPDNQKKMYIAQPCERVISMATSHSPWLSAPEELAGHLDAVAAGVRPAPASVAW